MGTLAVGAAKMRQPHAGLCVCRAEVRLTSLAAGLIVATALVLLGPAPSALAATITVNTSNDELAPNNGFVSLREAITAINAANDGGDSDVIAHRTGAYGANDTVQFNIFGLILLGCLRTIDVGGDPSASGIPLPAIVKPLTIDGYSQPQATPNTQALGSDASLCIELNGASAGANANGLTINAAGVSVKGLVIGSFSQNGIFIEQAGSGATIQGNFIGTNPSGTAALTNASHGILMTDASSVTVGGTTPAARNVVSGNTDSGIHVANSLGSSATGLTVQGNYVGTNAAGTAAIPNAVGVSVGNMPTVAIGGTAPGAGNLISGNNSSGIALVTVGTASTVQGNIIGLNATKTASLANIGAGVILVGANHATIGGTGPAEANVIAGNTVTGVDLFPMIGTNASVRGNAIFSNGGLGIDLGDDKVTANDPGDSDTGPNGLQNFPLLAMAATGDGTTTVAGTLNSSATTTFTLDFYANQNCDPSGHGEGQIFLGSGTATTDSSGDARFVIGGLSATATGNAIAATATDLAGRTSEFSTCQTAVAPGASATPATVSVTEGGALSNVSVQLDSIPTSAVVITPSFDTGQLRLTPATLTFQSDATALAPQTFTVTAVDNAVADGTRQRQVTLAASSSDTQYNGITISPVAATITDNDTALLSIADMTMAEPNSDTGTGTASLTVMLAPASTQTITVQFTTASGTATGGSTCGGSADYQTMSGMLTFSPGDTSESISLTACGDDLAETDETFTVALASPTGGSVLGAHATATVTITNTGTAPTANADTFTVANGSTLTVPAPGVLANDAPGATNVTLQAQVVTQAAHGGLTLGADGGFVYMPSADFAGTDSFTYRVSTGSFTSSPTTVSIVVTPTRCGPRPRVHTQPVAGGGQLQVTVQTTTLGTGEANLLSEIDFGVFQNGRVILDGQTISSGQVVTLPTSTIALVFVVQRVAPGQATTVPFTVKDACGAWPTFVGGGPGAF